MGVGHLPLSNFKILSKNDGLYHRFPFSTISFKVANTFQIVTESNI